jgi:hypothetical protein
MTNERTTSPLPIQFVGHQSQFTVDWLERNVQTTGPILACDFYVHGAEKAEPVPGGFSFGRVINIDHHAPHTDMMKQVSSTTLAIRRREALGYNPLGSIVVISHTDCDSVLSSGIASDELPADRRLDEAAIAADHTGAPNLIADLLQELDNIRAESKDKTETVQAYLRYCFDLILSYLTEGDRALDTRVLAALASRERKRAYARELIQAGALTMMNGVASIRADRKVDAEFFPPLLPEAIVIVVNRPGKKKPWKTNIRLGPAAPHGMSLNHFNIPDFDTAYGGRWNAGSNNRNGGTELSPEEYAGHVSSALSRITNSARSH